MNFEQWKVEATARYASAEWRAKRQAVLRRDAGRCQASFEICTRRATEVHHLTYRHWRNEPLFDLVAVCNSCHDLLTALDRSERGQEMERPATGLNRLEAQAAAQDLMQNAARVARQRERAVPAGGSARNGDPSG